MLRCRIGGPYRIGAVNHSPRRRVHPALWITPLAIAGGLLVITVTVVVALMAPWWMAAAQERDAQERTAQRDARVAAAAPAAHRRLHAELETYSYPAGWEYRFEQDTDRLPQVTRTSGPSRSYRSGTATPPPRCSGPPDTPTCT